MTADDRLRCVNQCERANLDSHATDMRELTVFFQMIIEQISLMLQESGESMDLLTESMTLIAANVSSIKAHAAASKSATMRRYSEAKGASKLYSERMQQTDSFGSLCAKAESNLNRAMTAIQFYDRLSQRILHVQQNLHALSEITSAQQIDHTALWRQLHARMQAVYTLEQEQILYEKLLARLPVEEATLRTATDRALGHAGHNSVDTDEPPSHGDIELF